MPIHLHREIERLKKQILSLCAFVEDGLHQAVKSVIDRDPELARKVIESDIQVDHAEIDVEEECLKILALHQPVAIDLRYIIACLKMNNDLERIGDLAVNIAKRAIFISKGSAFQVPYDLMGLGEKTQAMFRASLDALVNMDAKAAKDVCVLDDEIDDLNRDALRKTEEMIRKHPEHLESLVALISVSRALERIADHATNIAEDVVYMSEGRIARHGREFSEEGKPGQAGTDASK